jgi:DNA uptake protein and related DNA-binding proteins
VVVDVEGGVLRPGLVRLDAGARVADAIAAAGGYSPAADLLAAAAQINLAAILRDGQQVLVPMLGASTGGGGGSGAGNGLVDLNHASPEELDALPGIGPVTVQKIVAARTEQPFGTLDELVQRKVLTSAQLEKIRDLVTVS